MSADKLKESVRVLVALDEYDYAREEWRSRPSIQSWEKVESAWATLIATVREDEREQAVARVMREGLMDDTGTGEDEAYNAAIRHAVGAIRNAP